MNLESVQTITQRLDAAGIAYASGGSGMLYALGLTERVRDWDLTTDTSYETVAQALQDIDCISLPSGDYPFASSYRLSVEDTGLPVDIIGQFAIHSEFGICQLPTWITHTWKGLQMGSPEIWAAAYSLMKRDSKAELLFSHITEHGANHEIVHRLLDEPLPTNLRSRLQSLL
ncbi:hypothetical protein SAMN03159341_11227 [Paenibacillus sp. 1_12]|uniref:hypothetical protein n=1 Tax=Paenibacillus sp. 1_12 TaxID=1566278 RepID=UPI0008EE7B2A|nr:hypothetical protein [Paenibacillus sp. 1_12]SFL93030.1 hypothetical protein SAMN03159341_11227 [Paenibacillus sp. 1_12]